MQSVLLLLVALIPLFILPGFSFYYDVVPRLWFLLIVVSAILVLRPGLPAGVRRFYRTQRGRWFCWLLAAQAVSLLLSTALSSRPWLSVNGSTWRRFGLVTQLVLLLLALLLASDLLLGPAAIRKFLRSIALTGSVAAIYGILQYFGIDPFLDPSRYHIGEGIWTIVRPPGTLGHADYFGVYLLIVIFAGAAIRPTWRFWGTAAIALASCALLLTGTRAALLGAAAGLLVTAVLLRPRIRFLHTAIAAGMLLGLGVFYVSPLGTPLRARVRWASEDLRGGARLLLWRDTLRMAAQRSLAGYGPETFSVQFPHYQSVELARAYPDFYHESPHNLFLDTLAAQGFPGLLLSVGIIALGFAAAIQALAFDRRLAAVLTGALVALIVSHLFVSFTIATALCVFCILAAILALGAEPLQQKTAPSRIPAVVLASALLVYAFRLAISDHTLAFVRDRLTAMDVAGAAAEFQKVQGGEADLFFSRSMAAIAVKIPDPLLALQASQQAMAAASSAIRTSDEPANAAYNLASLYASRNQLKETEASLRLAIAAAPNWFKPHWMLARVLVLQQRFEEAETEAVFASDRAANPEVLQTLNEIKVQRQKSR